MISYVLNLYIKIGLSRCVSMGVAWMDGRSDDVRSGRRRRERGRHGDGYKQVGQTDRQAGS